MVGKGFTRKVALFFAALMIMTLGVSVSQTLAIDEVYYSGNDILFYNPDAQECSSTEIASSGDAPGNAFNFFISKGLNDLQAAAILGNFQQESSFQPTALNSIGAYGIAQWLNDRKARLLAKPFYSETNPDPAKELQVQLEFVWEELQTNEKGSYNALVGATTTSPGELAVIFGENYERYGEDEEGDRALYAEQFYAQFQGTVTSSGTCGVPAGSFVYYSQKDPKWGDTAYGSFGTIYENGCGPTSLAMIIATLVDNSVTPVEVAEAGAANGSSTAVGTAHLPLLEGAQSKWSFNYVDYTGQSLDKVIEIVKSGGLVYMGGQGPAPFTSGGHIVVMRGITEDGKIIIADPWRNAADVYDRETIDAYRGTVYAITK